MGVCVYGVNSTVLHILAFIRSATPGSVTYLVAVVAGNAPFQKRILQPT